MTTESDPAPDAPATPARVENPGRGLIGLFGVLIGIALMVFGFLGGLNAAFAGSGVIASVYTGVFILGGVLVLAALVFAIVQLVKGRGRVLAVFTIVLSLLPVIGVILLRLSVTGAFS